MLLSVDGTLFFADWCGHCVKFKPEWHKLKELLANCDKSIRFTTHEYEASNLPKGGATVQNKEIRGYPTIKITVTSGNKSKEYEYNGKRKAQDLFHHMMSDAIKNI